MSKRSFFVRSFAVALGALLYVSCDKRDNPIGPEPEPVDPMIEEITYEDVTAMVAVDKWGQAGFTGSWAAPEVDTKDGRHSGMAEVYGEVRVPGPPVLFALRAVGGDAHEIGEVRLAHCLPYHVERIV